MKVKDGKGANRETASTYSRVEGRVICRLYYCRRRRTSGRVLAIAHEQGGARWKLAADSDEARDAWRRALEPHCRASAPRPSADVRAVVPDLPPDLTATRRKALTRSSVATGDRGSTIVALTTFSFVVSVISAIVCSGGAFSVSVLALVHGYALVVLTSDEAPWIPTMHFSRESVPRTIACLPCRRASTRRRRRRAGRWLARRSRALISTSLEAGRPRRGPERPEVRSACARSATSLTERRPCPRTLLRVP